MNGINKAKERNGCSCASLSRAVKCSEQTSYKKDSFEFSRPISSRNKQLRFDTCKTNNADAQISVKPKLKGLAAIHVLVLTLFLVGIIVVFIAMVNNANVKELTILSRNIDIEYAEGLGTLLRASLEMSWQTIATQILFSNLDNRFNLPEYFYNFNASMSLPALPDGGCADGRLCLLTQNYANSQLNASIQGISLPSGFQLFVRLGRGLREFNRNVTLSSSGPSLWVAADGLHGRIDQSVVIGGPSETSINVNYTIAPNVSSGLNGLLGGARDAVSAATGLKYAGINYAEPRSRTIAAMQGIFESGFAAVLDIIGAGEAHYRLIPQFESSSSELRLGYDATVMLADDNRSVVTGLLNRSLSECGGLGTDMYNKYAGVIERARPDRLLAWVEEPRALLAVIAQRLSGWNPTGVLSDAGGNHNGLFGVLNGSFDPDENAAQAVDMLARAFENSSLAGVTGEDLLDRALVNFTNSSTDAIILPLLIAYDSWAGCVRTQADASGLNPNRIFGPEDYARFLTGKNSENGITVTAGDDFCSASDYPLRGYRKLAYDFYADTDSWNVYAAYPGVAHVDSASSVEGCDGAVWVQTGDFVIAYMHINPRVSDGASVTSRTRIGTVRTFDGQVCPNPKLTVMISSWDVTVPAADSIEDTNACGVRTGCSGFASAGTGMYVPNVNIKYQHCGALEWEALFRERSEGDGRLWRLLEGRNEWVRAPIVISFKMADSFTALTCSGEERYRWQNEKDMLCYNGKLWSCANNVSGMPNEQIATAGARVGDYTCVVSLNPQQSRSFKPDTSRMAYDRFVEGKRLTKWCKDGESDSDWLCCTGGSKWLGCYNTTSGDPPVTYYKYVIEGEALVCRDGGSCQST